MPSAPWARYRSAHRFAVDTEQFHRSAARRSVHFFSTMSRARRRRPAGVSWALAWDTKTSDVQMWVRGSSTPHSEVFVIVQQARRT